jgi:hypothetical protein
MEFSNHIESIKINTLHKISRLLSNVQINHNAYACLRNKEFKRKETPVNRG